MPRLNDAQHVLRRRGFVLDVASIDVGAVFEQVLRDLHGGSEVQRGLAVRAAGADHVGIGRHEFLQFLEHPQARRRVRIHHGAALDQKCRHIGRALIKNADAPGPPSASAR